LEDGTGRGQGIKKKVKFLNFKLHKHPITALLPTHCLTRELQKVLTLKMELESLPKRWKTPNIRRGPVRKPKSHIC
jgi:hypothetical protein